MKKGEPQFTPFPTLSGEWPAFPPNLRFVKKIGQGGIAKVYKAIQRPLGREVAVKLLTIATPEHRARFECEARLMSSFQHENITHVYDFYKESGRLYMVMELVEGVDISELLRDGTPFPPHIAAAVALKTARALEYIHNRKTVHRDIKPGNIMLSFDGTVKVMDFGIARHYGEQLSGCPHPNFPEESDQGIGTPAYISPEQLCGEEVDGRSDIYSLGVVLYRMLTGVKPFPYKSETTLFSKIKHDTPVRPRRLLPSLPRSLEKIVMRCLKKSPSDRYRDAAELMQHLERYLRRENPLLKYEHLFIDFLRSRNRLSSDTESMGASIASPSTDATHPKEIPWWPLLSLVLGFLLLTQTLLLLMGVL